MSIEIVALTAGAAASALSGVFANFIHERFSKKRAESESPAARLQKLLAQLTEHSKDVDQLMQEITSDIDQRQKALDQIQNKSAILSEEEKQLRARVEKLQNTPLEVAEYFQKINEANLDRLDKKSSKRDLKFFIYGIIVSTVVAILLKIFGLA